VPNSAEVHALDVPPATSNQDVVTPLEDVWRCLAEHRSRIWWGTAQRSTNCAEAARRCPAGRSTSLPPASPARNHSPAFPAGTQSTRQPAGDAMASAAANRGGERHDLPEVRLPSSAQRRASTLW